MAVCRIGSDSFFFVHISKLWTSIEFIYITVADGSTDTTGNRLGCIDATAKETCNVCSINKPCDITFNLLHTSTSYLSKASAVNIAFCVCGIFIGIWLINSGEIEISIITSSYIDRHFWRFVSLCSVATVGKILEPGIATNK